MRAVCGRLIALTLLLGLLVLGAAAARAGSFEDALAGFTTDSFSDTAEAVEAVATTGSPLAAPLLEALRESRLVFSAKDKKVFIKTRDGALLDAATTNPVSGAPPDDLETVRINNRLRNLIDAALGSLTLMAPDPNRRFDAAQAVFKSRDAGSLPALDKALAAETNPRVKKAMQEARAAIVLNSSDASEADKIAAIAVARERGDQDALALLQGLPANVPMEVHRAARAASERIQNNLALWNAVQNAWYGLSLGSVLLLAAIGLAITFGVMGVINMAHGEMVMLGAYTTFVVQEVIRQNYPGLFDLSLAAAIPLAFLVSGAVGILIERTVIQFLYGRPLETLLST